MSIPPEFDFDAYVLEKARRAGPLEADTAAEPDLAVEPVFPRIEPDLEAEPEFDFDEHVRSKHKEQLRGSVIASIKLDAKTEGRAAELNAKTGVSPEAAARNLDLLDQEFQIQSLPWQEVEESVAAVRFLSNPRTAAIVRPDLVNMMKFRNELAGGLPPNTFVTLDPTLWEASKARLSRGMTTAFEMPDVVAPILMAEWGFRGPNTPQEIGAYQQFTRREQPRTEGAGIIAELTGPSLEAIGPLLATGLGALERGGQTALLGLGIGAAVGTFAPGPGTVAGAFSGAAFGFRLGANLGAGEAIFWMEASGARIEFGGLTDVDGKPIPRETIAAAAAVVGFLNAGLELGSLRSILKIMPGSALIFSKGSKVARALVLRKLKDPRQWMALKSGAAQIFARLGIEGTQELVQEFNVIQVGKIASGKFTGAPLITPEEGKRLASAFKEGFLGSAGLVGVGRGTNFAIGRIAGSTENTRRLQKAREIIRKVKMGETSPTTLRDMSQAMAVEAGHEQVGIRGRGLVDQYLANGLTLEDLIADVPEVESQIEDALVNGGEVKVPIGRYYEILDPRFGEALDPEIRLTPGSLTQVEAEQTEANLERDAVLESQPIEDSQAGVATESAERVLGLRERLIPETDTELLTFDERNEYEGAVAEGRLRAVADLKRAEDKKLRERRKEEREEQSALNRARRKAVRVVTALVNAEPVHFAMDFLRIKLEPQEVRRLDRDTVIELYGEDVLAALPRSMWQINGEHPDAVADMFGFDNGFVMVNEMMFADKKAQIAEEVDARIVEEFGDPALEGIDESSALDSVVNDEKMRALQIEQRAIARRAGRNAPVTPWQVLKKAAERDIARTQVGRLDAAYHQDTAVRLNREAVEAFAAGDFALATELVRQQLEHIALEAATRAQLGKVAANEKFIKESDREANRQKVGLGGPEYLAQQDQLLERFGFRPKFDPDVLELRDSLQVFVDQQEAIHEDIIAKPWMLEGERDIASKELTVQQLQDVRNLAKNLQHVAGRQLQITTKTERAQLESVNRNIVEVLVENFPRGEKPTRFTPEAWQEFKDTISSADAALRKPEAVSDVAGGEDPGSFFRRFVFEPLNVARELQDVMLAAFVDKVKAIRAKLPEGREKKYNEGIAEARLLDRDGRPISLTLGDLIAIGRNLGNASNIDKLLRGMGWDINVVLDVLNKHLDQHDAQLIQGYWDINELLWPEVAALEERMTGVAPTKIEAQAVTIAGVELRGGYMPIVYDRKAPDIDVRSELTPLLPGRGENVTRPGTAHGNTIERTKFAEPLLLTESVFMNHIDGVILDITHREAIIDVNKVVSDRKVNQALKDAFGDAFGYDAFFGPMLKSLARNTLEPKHLEGFAKMFRGARRLATVGGLALRASTLILQVAGLLPAVRLMHDRMGPGATAALAQASLRSYGLTRGETFHDVRAQVANQTAFMRGRLTNIDPDLARAFKARFEILAKRDRAVQFMLGAIAYVQFHMVDVPVWLGTYEFARANMGMTVKRAEIFADSMVRESQGAAGKLDLSAWQRGDAGGGFLKDFALFYSYNNTMYNRLFKLGRFRGAGPVDKEKLLLDYFFYAMAPAMYNWLMRALWRGGVPEKGDREYEKFWRKSAIQVVAGDVGAMIPIVRDLAPVFGGYRPGRSGAISPVFRDAYTLINDKDGEDRMLAFFGLAGYALGVPIKTAIEQPLAVIKKFSN